MKPLVSILVAAFNAERTIGCTVRSCLAQKGCDVEVIVIDDGSTDGTAAAARTAAGGDDRVRVVTLGSNAGVSAARNAAWELARGEWCSPVDADDTIAPERCGRLVDAARRRGSDLVADNLAVYRTDIAEEPSLAFPRERMRRTEPVDAAEYVRTDRPGWGTRASGFVQPIMRRRFFERHGLRYAEAFTHGEDFHLVVRALLRGAIMHYVDEAHYWYGISPGSLSRRGWQRILRSFYGVSTSLRHDAAALGRDDVAVALEEREAEMRAWIGYRELRAAVVAGRFAAAARLIQSPRVGRYAAQTAYASLRRRLGFPVGTA